MWNSRNSHSLLVGVRKVQPLGKADWHFSITLIIPYHLMIMLLSIYPKGFKPHAHPKICTHKFRAPLCIIAQNSEATWISVSKWVYQLWHPHNGILFSTKYKWAIKPWKIMDTIKLLGENIGRILFDMNHSNYFLDLSPKVKLKKAKVNRWYLINFETFAQHRKPSTKQKVSLLNGRRYL